MFTETNLFETDAADESSVTGDFTPVDHPAASAQRSHHVARGRLALPRPRATPRWALMLIAPVAVLGLLAAAVGLLDRSGQQPPGVPQSSKLAARHSLRHAAVAPVMRRTVRRSRPPRKHRARRRHRPPLAHADRSAPVALLPAATEASSPSVVASAGSSESAPQGGEFSFER